MLVLIVEDDPMIALDLEDIVRSQLRADVVFGESVRTAAPLLDQPLDFALFDVDLKDGKSHDLAATLQRRNVPFAFVSGSRRQDLPRGLQSVPFVPKPYSPAEIGRTIREIAARRVHAPAALVA